MIQYARSTMTIAAQRLGMCIIPIGKCTFELRVLRNYKPTAIVGSVFKLLRLARRLTSESLRPSQTSINKLTAGGESFADESRTYLAEMGMSRFTTRMEALKERCVGNART